MATQEPLGRLVRRYRRAAELSQEALAERAGLSVRAIRDIEAGTKHRPRQDTVQLLLEALDVPGQEQAAFLVAAAQVAEQEGRITAPPATGVQTFLLADIRGYTRFTAEHGDEAAAELAAGFAALARETVAGHQGAVIELRGDEALAVFASPRQALRAALALQDRFSAERQPELPLEVGVGLDVGEGVPVQGGYRSGALNLAARLCSLATAGEVFASEGVIHLARKVEGLVYLDRGEASLKGLPQAVKVIQVVAEGQEPAEIPRFTVPARPRTNLPLQPTPFIGRERELEEVRGMVLRDDIRLLTLTGAGGTGKTRLALQVAGQLLDAFPDGVYFVSLASLTDPGLVASTIAGTLGIKEVAGTPILETLAESLKEKRLLLVPDNFEHLLDAAEVVQQLLVRCADLKVLLTSRAVLHLSAEHDYLVPPLALPDLRHLPELKALSQYDAIKLFIQRAQAAKLSFAVTNENAPAVAEICYRLDGLPLAIELAAARIRLLPPPVLLARLQHRLPLLTGGAKDLPARQQTLRATIDWSYSLLNEVEQQLFARLSVFQGGCTLEAAEEVCSPAGDFDMGVLDGLGSLIEKSLLRQEGEDALRFLMLETIREYATERLEASGEVEQTREQHAQYYLRLAKALEPELEGGQAEWFDRLVADLDNLRAALAWFVEAGAVEQELRLAAALWRIWSARCYFSEGRQWLEAGLSQSEQVSLPVRMEALRAAGALAMLQSDQTRTATLAEELLTLARELADPVQTMRALVLLGMIAIQRGDHHQAADYLEEYHSIARAQGSRFDVAHSLMALGNARSEAGAYAEAVGLLKEALMVFRAMGNEYWEMIAVGTLAYAVMLAANQERARSLLLEYLALAQRFEDTSNVAASLEGLAILASEEGRADRATRLFAAADFLRRQIGSRLMSRRNLTMLEHAVDSARQQLGETAWLAAWEEGRVMTVEQAVAMALEDGALDNDTAVRPRKDHAAVEPT